MEDHLTWMARNVHEWPYPSRDTCFIGHGYHDQVLVHSDSITGLSTIGRHQISKQKWLARRAELQNKPSWKDAPEDASYLAQEPHGMWTLFFDQPYEPSKLNDDGWRFNGFQAWCSECRGEVLGDWRDTLEQRPVDLSEPAGDVKERGTDGNEESNAMAQRLLAALKSEPRSFDTGTLAEMVELADAEIVKRDADVCGGQHSLNNHWFERGELPPVGVECEVLWNDAEWYKTKILAILEIDGFNKCPVFTTEWSDTSFVDCMPHYQSFRPLRSDRGIVIEDLILVSGLRAGGGAKEVAERLYEAGYRKQG